MRIIYISRHKNEMSRKGEMRDCLPESPLRPTAWQAQWDRGLQGHFATDGHPYVPMLLFSSADCNPFPSRRSCKRKLPIKGGEGEVSSIDNPGPGPVPI